MCLGCAGRGGNGVVGCGAVFVGEGQRREGLAQVPGQVPGERAEEQVGTAAVRRSMVFRDRKIFSAFASDF